MREGVKVGDLSMEELKALIKEVLLEVMDPDYGLELRPEVEKALLESLDSRERYSLEEVARELGLDY